MYFVSIDKKRMLDLVLILKTSYEICYFDKSTFSKENLKISLLSRIRQGKKPSNILTILNDIPSINLHGQVIKYLKDLSAYFYIIFICNSITKNTKTHLEYFKYDHISNSSQFVFQKEIDICFFSKLIQNLKMSKNIDHNCIYKFEINILEAIFNEKDIQTVKSLFSILLIKSFSYVRIKSLFKRLKISYPNTREDNFYKIIHQLKNFFFQFNSEEESVKFFDENFLQWMKINNYLNEKEGYQIEAIYNWSKICEHRFGPNRSSTPINSSVDLSSLSFVDLNLSQIKFDKRSTLFFENWRQHKWLKKHRYFLNKSLGYNDYICFSKMLLIHNSAKEMKFVPETSTKSFIFDETLSLFENSDTEKKKNFFNTKSKSCFSYLFSSIFSFFKK